MRRSLVLLIALVATGHAEGLPPGTLVDLTHAYDAATVYWPTEEGFVLEKEFFGKTKQGYFYASNRFRAAEHGGTHIDAPIHFAQGHRTVDQIPLDQVIGDAVLVDVTAACARDPGHAISVADLERWEQSNGAIAKNRIVLLRTGFGRYWPDRKRYLGTDERGAAGVAHLRFPGLAPEAASWLLKRGLRAVGIDTASIDPGRSTTFDSHRLLFQADVPAFENLAELERLPAKGSFVVIALPMKIAGGSGGPLRIVALVPKVGPKP